MQAAIVRDFSGPATTPPPDGDFQTSPLAFPYGMQDAAPRGDHPQCYSPAVPNTAARLSEGSKRKTAFRSLSRVSIS